jgi:hypothetical protein
VNFARPRVVRAVLLASVLAGVVAAPACAAVDLAKHPSALQTVPMQFRPKWRWWWPTANVDKAELARELEAIKTAGFGGVEQVLLRSPNDWWAPAFRENTKYAVQKATDLGLKFDVTLGPEWPISSKGVDDISKGLSMQEAIFSSVPLIGPSTYVGPAPRLDGGGVFPRTLVALTAAQVTRGVLANPVAGGAATPLTLDPKTAVDLTAKLSNGLLTWQVPPGRWALVATWMRPSGQRPHGDVVTIVGGLAQQNLPIALPDLGGLMGPLVPDHFSHAAIDATLADYDKTLFGGDMAGVLRRNGGDVFEDSLELDHTAPIGIPLTNFPDGCAFCLNKFWTPSFLSEFKKRRGYDLTPLLPAVFGAFNLADGGQQRLRADYDRTLSELLVDNHYKAISAWAGARGLQSRAQGYNLVGTDKTNVSAGLQLPDTESLDDGETGSAVAPGSATSDAIIDDYRQVVSAGHLSGAATMSLEAGANLLGEYNLSQADYKVIADRAFAAGVTTMIFHGFAYRSYQDLYQLWSWPGWSAFNLLFAESWNQTHPQIASGLWSGLASYDGRVSAVLQSGQPRVDLTVLSAARGPHAYGSAALNAVLDHGDYSYDRIDDRSLTALPLPLDKRLLAGGPSYKAVVVDAMSALSGASADRLLAIAKAGEPVVVFGEPPARGVSYKSASGEDKQVRDDFAALLALANVRQIKDPKQLSDALAGLHVVPDLARSGSPIVAQHRHTAAGDVWFLYNNSTKPAAGQLTFAATGRPAQIDPWSGLATALSATSRSKRATTLSLTLAGGSSTIVSFGASAKAKLATPAAPVSDVEPITVKGPWKLHVDSVGPSGAKSADLTLDALSDWRKISSLASASGTGSYTSTVAIPDGWLAAGRAVLLDPGDYGGMAQVDVNGSRAALPGLPDGPRDITALLRPGVNTLRVTLATTVTNAIVGAAQSGDVRYAEFAIDSKQPYGLLGPVRLIAAARAVSRSARCSSRRRFTIHVRAPRGFRARSATLRIGATTRRVHVSRSGRRLRVVVNLAKRPQGTVRVRLTIRGTGRETLRTARTYRLCATR